MPAKNQILLVMWCHIAAHQLNDINRISLHIQLNILLFRAKCYDNRKFTTCQIQDQCGIRKTGKDNGVVAREKQSMRRFSKYYF